METVVLTSGRTLSTADYFTCGGFAGLRKALELDPAEAVAQVTESGLRGRGDAGFPGGDQVEDGARSDE
jgi:NADH:ubiquinone oxidoreductase subunit F (NADH-binding)